MSLHPVRRSHRIRRFARAAGNVARHGLPLQRRFPGIFGRGPIQKHALMWHNPWAHDERRTRSLQDRALYSSMVNPPVITRRVRGLSRSSQEIQWLA